MFVKNLESVQGDERDIMYFSVTYGPDLTGAVSMNFGPLNRDGGERRLNVAVTRARHELRVFSSLRGDQMDLSRTQAVGVRDLKHFLEFAERGPRALAEAHLGSRGDYESPFEASVAAALGRKGWQVHAQIGASSFRVDLGVVHPDFAGRYLAGIECDGATYHRSATARDRDKLREQILRGKGWEILRIWSTDWWVNPGGTLECVHERLSALLTQDRERRAAEDGARTPGEGATDNGENRSPANNAVDEAAQPIAQTAPQATDAKTHLFHVSQPADAVPDEVVSAERFYEPWYDHVLQRMVERVVQQEGPVLDAVLARRIARAHGFQRTGSRIQDRVEEIARRNFAISEEAAGTFYWPAGVVVGVEIAFRWPADDGSARSVEEICAQELTSLTRWVLGSGMRGEDALIAMARELGLARLRAASRARLEAVLAGVNLDACRAD